MKTIIKKTIGIMFCVLILTSCSTEPPRFSNDENADKPHVTKNLESITRDDQGYVIDEQTGCLYLHSFGQYDSHLTPVYGSNGMVVGCKNSQSESVEEYLNLK